MSTMAFKGREPVGKHVIFSHCHLPLNHRGNMEKISFTLVLMMLVPAGLIQQVQLTEHRVSIKLL
ncbi:hypothetical protein V5J35_004247 [Endozoicomonas sp. NE40]|uniref:Uncharacterized protein n=1 Tax=Endozoicomonas lisbonensis TaxID=3120522 RepID=A0ABV2SMR1_9GAMM